jgi:hypothetical protein
MSVLINASISSGLVQTADTSGTLELQSNGTTQLTVSSTGAYGQLKSGTAVASTSGTSISFTGIPSWVKRITVLFNSVSTNGSNLVQVQLGAGSVDIASYTGSAVNLDGAIGGSANSTGFLLMDSVAAASTFMGIATISLLEGNIWVFSSNGTLGSAAQSNTVGAGVKTLSGTLDRLRIIASATGNPSDTFDAGSINILYEG